MEAERHLEYDRTRGGVIYQTSVHSRGTITLNAKFGMVGSEDKPIQVNSAKRTFCWSEKFACLREDAQMAIHMFILLILRLESS